MEDNLSEPAIDQHTTQWFQISQQVFADIPKLSVVWNPLAEARMRFPPWSDHPVAIVSRYVRSLHDTSGQALFALDQLRFFSTREASNVSEFFVHHYLYDFISRVKTSTDIVALIINCIHQVGLPDKACSLESGSFVGKIRSRYPNDDHVEKLARIIDRARTSWLGTFDTLRDIIIHQSGFQFDLVGSLQHRVHISIPIAKYIPGGSAIRYDPKNPLAALASVAKEDILVRLLTETRSGSVSEFLATVDPVVLCEELWKRTSQTVDSVLEQCVPCVLGFISDAQQD